MLKPDPPKIPYWKKLCLELRVSEDEIAVLVAKNPAEKAKFLVAMFATTQNSDEKAAILSLLGVLGDVEIAGDFLADVLQSGSDREKFWASIEGRMTKFEGHLRLRRAIKAHLQGKSAAEVRMRNEFPDGCCPLRKKVDPRNEKPPVRSKIGKLARTPRTRSLIKRDND